jgi:hypothetical protein
MEWSKLLHALLLCSCEGENLTRCFVTTETEKNKIIVNDKTIFNSALNAAVIFKCSDIHYCHETEWFITVTPKPATGTHSEPNEFIHILTHCCFLQYIAVFYSTPWPNIPSDTPFSYNTFQCYTAFHGSNIPRGFQTKTLTPKNTKCLAHLNITTATEDEVHNHNSPHYKILYIILSVHFS